MLYFYGIIIDRNDHLLNYSIVCTHRGHHTRINEGYFVGVGGLVAMVGVGGGGTQ